MFPATRSFMRALAVAALFSTLSGSTVAAPAPPAPAHTATKATSAVKATPAQPAGPLKLTILHTNDMHGHLTPETDKSIVPPPEKVGGAAYLATLIKQYRAANPDHTLLLDDGDIAQGTPVSNLFWGRPMAQFMNAVKYDAGTVGNHEFDWGAPPFRAMVNLRTFPVVCANIIDVRTGKLPFGLKRFIIKDLDGVKIGITGVITSTTPSMSFKQNVASFRFDNEVDVLKTVIPEMRKAGAQVIVVLSHNGDKDDSHIAEQVPGIAVIVGGHSHTAMNDPIFVNGTVIVQAGKYMRYLGKLDVTLDRKTFKVISYTKKGELVPVITAKIKPDPAIEKMVTAYMDKIGPAMEAVVGQCETDLPRTPASGQCDSALGDVVTDALRDKVSADVAVYNAGGIRTDFNKGPLKMSDIFTLLPFDNYVVSVMMSGEQLQRLFAQGLSDAHGTVQISGASFKVGADGKPADIKIGGHPIDPKKMYKVATVDFLAEGNDGLLVFKEVRDRTIDALARDVFLAYVRKNSPLKAPTTGRITRTSAP